jgi:hypothetical protein
MSEATATVSQTNSNGLATASLVLGIVGLVIGLIPFLGWFMFPVWILAIVFGIIGRKQSFKRTSATVGMILGIITLIYKFGFWIIVAFVPTDEMNDTTTAFDNNTNEVVQNEEENEESNENSNNTSLNNEENNANEDETEENLENQTFGVGDAVEHDDYSLVVNDVEKSQGEDFDEPSDGNEYVIVEVTIDNNGDDTISYNPYHFNIQNSQGNITDTTFTTIDSDTSLSSGDLAPGGTVSGTLAFEAPVDDPELELIFEPSFWSADEVRVELN